MRWTAPVAPLHAQFPLTTGPGGHHWSRGMRNKDGTFGTFCERCQASFDEVVAKYRPGMSCISDAEMRIVAVRVEARLHLIASISGRRPERA